MFHMLPRIIRSQLYVPKLTVSRLNIAEERLMLFNYTVQLDEGGMDNNIYLTRVAEQLLNVFHIFHFILISQINNGQQNTDNVTKTHKLQKTALQINKLIITNSLFTDIA